MSMFRAHVEKIEQKELIPQELFQDGDAPITSNAQLRRQVGKAAMNYVVRLDRDLGHPGSKVLCKMVDEVMQMCYTTEDVIKAARGYVCPECFIRQGPAGVLTGSRIDCKGLWQAAHGSAWIDNYR